MTEAEWVAAAIIGTLAVARTLRLVIWDDFPPVAWLRLRGIALLGDTWGKLLTCQFCLAPYAVAVMMGWAYASDLHWTWWIINGWWAASYLAAIVVAYDQPDE